MKILLLMPRSKMYRKGHGFRKNLTYAPLTLTTLASLVPKELNAEIKIIDEGAQIANYQNLKADIIGISYITGTAPRAYRLADMFRKKGITVVLGGPHATLLPNEAKKHADSVVTGIAVRTWPKLLKDFSKGKLKKFYSDKKIHLAGLPIPRRDLLRKRGYITTNTVQATYGCPNKCEFCVVHKIRNGYLQRPIPEVINEIKQLKAKIVLFLDSSPIEDKKYIKKLYRALIPLKIKWMGLATTKITDDNELFSLAVKSGCRGLLLGFESVSQKSLYRMRKGFNQVEKYKQLVKKLHANNIAIMGCFVFGSDDDEKSIFEDTIKFVQEVGIDLPRFTVMTPFPGTPLYTRLQKEGRITNSDWSKYDAQHVVFKPKNMSEKELQEGLLHVWKTVYKPRNIFRRINKSRSQTLLMILANIGYHKYAKELSRERCCE